MECRTPLVFAMNLALDEIVTNIIVHGYSEVGEHEIRSAITVDEDALEATVRDDAPAFNPLLVDPSISRPLRRTGRLAVSVYTSCAR